MTEQILQLATDKQGDLTLLQMTDTHLYSEPDGELLGVNTRDSFLAVMEAVLAQSQQYQAVLATGDISQDHTEASYRVFTEQAKKLSAPCFWLPGNHDFQPALQTEFAAAGISACKHIISEYWQLVLLDTQVVGVPHGQVSEQQLGFLKRALGQYPDKHALVLLHHHSVPAGCAWLDQHSLKNADDLFAVLAQHDNANTLLCGHIHQTMDKQYQGVRLLATPSTCIQFKPNSDDFALDQQEPGWRYLTLKANGEVDTQVHRLIDAGFVPDANATGY
ncbi:3',5'-cyclic-AMP phosphodiesterase [Motilimonas pumila]|uniref:3',5'-cyclic adenosine monophosphate phosphodiesterase CpdA n=1 Tax=Motilimonas pumila TaxID=2303987 RepID=A0A418YAU9_9GAMM|nr:3',5'-cyclic-AMP phosphodiesterase [Motilimonas pumila]RJG40104.1 3',5'-cyclic-AMP phosphodiesterase [Motilimonas pumila]